MMPRKKRTSLEWQPAHIRRNTMLWRIKGLIKNIDELVESHKRDFTQLELAILADTADKLTVDIVHPWKEQSQCLTSTS